MNTLQKNSFFNRFFRENSFKGGLSKNRHGLAIYRRFYTPKTDVYLNTNERYFYEEKPSSTTFFLFYLPCGISFSIWVLLLINLLVVIFTDGSFYWPILLIIPIYSFITVNVLGLTYDRVKFKGAYFDRLEKKVSFTWKVKNAEEFDMFGNPTFNWEDIECHTKNEFAVLGIMKGFIEIRHKNLDLYPNAKLTINASGDTSKPVQCFLEWESIVRHMEQDKPLPDTPEYELYRELDPITKSFDESNGRPKGFWTQFSLEQQREIEEQIFQEAIKFDWSEGKVQPEITKPWEVWTPDPKRPPKPRGMFTMIMLQLVFCYPE